MAGTLRFVEISVKSGGNNGVVAKLSSTSSRTVFASTMSIGAAISSRPYMLRGGVRSSSDVSAPYRTELETEDERLEVLLSRSASEAREFELAPRRSLNLREKEGNLVPNRVVRLLKAESFALRFLLRGDGEVSPSLKKPLTKS